MHSSGAQGSGGSERGRRMYRPPMLTSAAMAMMDCRVWKYMARAGARKAARACGRLLLRAACRGAAEEGAGRLIPRKLSSACKCTSPGLQRTCTGRAAARATTMDAMAVFGVLFKR